MISRIWLCWWWDAVVPEASAQPSLKLWQMRAPPWFRSDLANSKLVAVGQKLVEQGHRVLTQAVDLVSENSVEELVSFAQKSFGRLDAVVNAAAATNLTSRDRGVTDMEAAVWDQMFAVNVRGAMFFCNMPYRRCSPALAA
jgi:NAD(P)-dependent dehydrogenase (short-subunit alcohol dehydrogenase family)